ncbi:cytochrome P450 [Calothrix sp. NIES-3974]|uniref:cytochrome P450 n=1 Tax=Calothrix sp. NIES-3974 TaxID=2005462 RepID=UPI0012FD8078|nr:cytochrome P450 [Calothrix sp. NIES-3974]
MPTNSNNFTQPSYLPLSPEHQANPYGFLRQARQEYPIFYSPTLRLWIVTRYADIIQVLKDTKSFSSANSNLVDLEVSPEVEAVLKEGYPNMPRPSLVDNDPPGHTRIRALVNSVLTPASIAALEPRIYATANALVDEWIDAGRVDIVSKFASPLPLLIMGDFLGIPRADIQTVKKWCDDWLVILSGGAPVEQHVECARSFVSLQHYVTDILEQRSVNPQPDLLTALLNATVEGEANLSPAEIISLVMQLVFAGHETTAHLIGNAVALLVQHPEQLEALQQNPSLAVNAVEEVLRFESPVPGLIRTTTEAVELGGVQIPKGARLQLLYASGNRDEIQFSEPESFDIQRPPNGKHLAFGGGIHYCVGAALARLEGRIALEVLTQRLSNLRMVPNQEILYYPSIIIRGLLNFWVEWDTPSSVGT